MGSRGTCLVLIGAALVAGCGDDDDDNGSTSDTRESRQTPVQQDAVAKSDARNLATVVESCFVDAQDYSLCEDPVGPDTPTAFLETADVSTYTVVAPSESGTSFRLEKTKAGTLKRTCTEPGKAGCPANGRW